MVGQEYAGPSMHEITMHAREQTYFLTQRRPTLITNRLNYFLLRFFAALFSVYQIHPLSGKLEFSSSTKTSLVSKVPILRFSSFREEI